MQKNTDSAVSLPSISSRTDITDTITVTGSQSTSIGGITFGSKEVRKALVHSLWDGIFSNGMLALTETFSIAGAVFLNAPAIAIALLGSFPLLLSSIGQLILPWCTKKSETRKKYVLRGILSQSFFLAVLAFCGFFPEHIRSWSYVFIFSLYGFSGNVVSGLWIAWMGDLVPKEFRGRHFAWRNRFFSFTQLICTLIAGFFLKEYSTGNATWVLFTIVFLLAAFFRLCSSCMMYLQLEPPVTKCSIPVNFRNVIKNKVFVHYCLAAALMQGTVAVAGPFFNVWYIRDLKFDYFTLAIASAATVLGTISALPVWGRLADSIGNRRVILFTGFLICTVPLPYLISSHPWHIWVLNYYTGFCWSGYNLGNFNYLLLASGKNRPEISISFSVAVNGVSVFIFSMIGGYLSHNLPHIFAWQLQSLFLLSAILRFVIFGAFFSKFKSYELEKGKATDLFFQIPGYRGGLGVLRNAFRAFRAK
ncbi:MAG TPA: MFS transporter [Chitinispirillaceae bacterium]|nr:MFS transporter [Chitinispirillaceae bacterium]